MDFDTCIKKDFKGRRILLLGIDTCDNHRTTELLKLFEEARSDMNADFRIVFVHYGRPSKAHFELTQWLKKTQRLNESWVDNFVEKLKEADKLLVQ